MPPQNKYIGGFPEPYEIDSNLITGLMGKLSPNWNSSHGRSFTLANPIGPSLMFIDKNDPKALSHERDHARAAYLGQPQENIDMKEYLNPPKDFLNTNHPASSVSPQIAGMIQDFNDIETKTGKSQAIGKKYLWDNSK